MSSVTDHNTTREDRIAIQKNISDSVPSHDPGTLRIVLSYLKEGSIDGPSEVPKILQAIPDDGMPILHRVYEGDPKNYEKSQEVTNILIEYGANPLQKNRTGQDFFSFKSSEDTKTLFDFQQSLTKAISSQKPSKVHNLIFNNGPHFQEAGLLHIGGMCQDINCVQKYPLINRLNNISQTYKCSLEDAIIATKQNYLLSRSDSLLHQAISYTQRGNIPTNQTTLDVENGEGKNTSRSIPRAYPVTKSKQKLHDPLRTRNPRVPSPLGNRNLI